MINASVWTFFCHRNDFAHMTNAHIIVYLILQLYEQQLYFNTI